MSSSVAAIVRGFHDHDRRIRLAGVICNRVGSDRHADLLRDAIAPLGVPVLGCLRRDDAFVWRDRHLGLVPVAEQPEVVRASLDRLAVAVIRDLDLAAIEAVVRTAPSMTVADPPRPEHVGSCRFEVAAGPAFTFAYTDNHDVLAAAGPRSSPSIPATTSVSPTRSTA